MKPSREARKSSPHWQSIYRQRTLDVLAGGIQASPDEPEADWLDYKYADSTAKMNRLLLTGATVNRLVAKSGRRSADAVRSHVSSLRDGLGSEHAVVCRKGVYQFDQNAIAALEVGYRPLSRPVVVEPPGEVAEIISSAGAGFGDPEQNRRVERAAIKIVRRQYPSPPWSVEDVQRRRGLGYDLVCQNGTHVEHVEVKGVSGSAEEVILTASEARATEADRRHVVYIVTNALSNRPVWRRYTGTEFQDLFKLTPIAYRATRRPDQTPPRAGTMPAGGKP